MGYFWDGFAIIAYFVLVIGVGLASARHRGDNMREFSTGSRQLPWWAVLASITVCGATWFLIERTRLGATLRAATENARLVQAFGINVPILVTATYGAGAALAALLGPPPQPAN